MAAQFDSGVLVSGTVAQAPFGCGAELGNEFVHFAAMLAPSRGVDQGIEAGDECPLTRVRARVAGLITAFPA